MAEAKKVLEELPARVPMEGDPAEPVPDSDDERSGEELETDGEEAAVKEDKKVAEADAVRMAAATEAMDEVNRLKQEKETMVAHTFNAVNETKATLQNVKSVRV